jgi:predicted GH43/DUF377 family glycosyl hydrolase
MNKIEFKKYPGNPVIPNTPGSFYSRYAANPDLLFYRGKYHLYFRGQGDGKQDQIGAAFAAPDLFDGIHWDFYPENPVIPAGEPDQFDGRHVLDPAAVLISNKVFCCYSGHPFQGKASIGLAVSKDGITFQKAGINPVIPNAIAPETVFHNGKLHLFYQRDTAGYFELYKCTSPDGYHFDERDERKVFGPSGPGHAFDSFSISTCRIWREDEWFFMTYGGCRRFKDYPEAFGLARSRDLASWERYPGNPILTRGAEGAWDEGAVWFATVHKEENTRYLWYEGTGTSGKFGAQASAECRGSDYGGYGRTSFSQIGMAVYEGPDLSW